MKDIRIALVMFNAPVGEVENNLDRMNDWVKKAKQQGVQLICFPELNVSGYSTRKDFPQPSEAVFNETVSRLQIMAKDNGITLLAGMMESKEENGVYASHLVFDTKGLVGIYRKIHIAPPEKDLFSPGNDIPLFETNGITFGIQLCYDAHFPELSTHLALKGAEMIFLPHASPRGTPKDKFHSWMRHLTARAYDNSVFILAVNQVGDNKNELTFPGVALVIAPSGEVVGKKLSDKEAMLVVDLKENDLTSVRNNRMHYFLPNRREDLLPVYKSL